jgi:hypothetical protein
VNVLACVIPGCWYHFVIAVWRAKEAKSGLIDVQMVKTLDEHDWRFLLIAIRKGMCTPFLGAGASFPAIPLGETIATTWAEEFNYPGENPRNLLEVAEYMAVENDPILPKVEISGLVHDATPPDFNSADEPHGLLADLPFSIYLTTNYDDFMVRALTSRGRDPRRGFCRWNERLASVLGEEKEPAFDDTSFTPTIDHPLVFHFHGCDRFPETIVLTERDYLRFLANMGRIKLPHPVERALEKTACLFIGYRLADWNFRVLFTGLAARSYEDFYTRSIAVLKPPGGDDERAQRQRKYLDHYYNSLGVRVYWGTAREFTAELRERWNKVKAESDNA